MKTQKFPYGTYFLFIAAILAFILACSLPVSAGLENGPIEWFQVIVLVLGIPFFWYTSSKPYISENQRRLLLLSIPIWLILIGRELSWGRVFYPIGEDEFVPLNFFWYGPYLRKTIGAVMVFLLYAVYKAGICGEIRRWCKNYKRLGYDILIIIGSVFLEELFDRQIISFFNDRAMLYEELCETIAYLAMTAFAYDLFYDGQVIDRHEEARQPLHNEKQA